MKIIHIEDYFDPTAGYQINELLYASKDFSDEVFLITSEDMSPFHKKNDVALDKEFEIKTNVTIIRLKSKFKLSARLILEDLNKTINKIQPDIVFMHGIGDFKDFQLWHKKKDYKVIRDCHMSWVASQNKLRKIYYIFFKLLFASIINKTDKYEIIYALGEEEYEYLNKIGIEDHKIDFLPHGYNDSVMYYDLIERETIRNKYKFSDEDIIIAYIGKFNNSKRPDIIIDIISLLDKEFIDSNKIKILFIGPKDNLYIEYFMEKLKTICNKITIVIDDSKPFIELRKYYSASDICVFPKETSLSSIHAQVCGCPVVMEKYKSNIERVVDPENLYQIDDIVEASNIIKRIIVNSEYKKNRSQASQLKHREYKNQVKKLQCLMKNE